MTDNEIIKALECCCSPKVNACDDCPFYERCYENNEWLEKEAIDLINRQKAEIEKKDVEVDILIRKKETLEDEISELKAEIERLRKANENFSCLGKMYSEIKSEARKEFAERFWAESAKILGTNTLYWIKEIKNKLLAEMESDGK